MPSLTIWRNACATPTCTPTSEACSSPPTLISSSTASTARSRSASTRASTSTRKSPTSTLWQSRPTAACSMSAKTSPSSSLASRGLAKLRTPSASWITSPLFPRVALLVSSMSRTSSWDQTLFLKHSETPRRSGMTIHLGLERYGDLLLFSHFFYSFAHCFLLFFSFSFFLFVFCFQYMVMQFNRAGEPIGGHVRNYLLEKNRIVMQVGGERSFHIFYQLLAGSSKAEITELHLAPPEDFEYLKNGDQEIPHLDDSKECAHTRKAMDLVQISTPDQQSIFRVVAAVLHIGNIIFSQVSGKDESTITNPDRVGIVSKLLSCDTQALIKALTSRTVRAASSRTSSYEVPLTLAQAQHTREALAKSLYGRLFDWLVLYINKSIQMDEVGFVIGVLDIYGFEIFGQNSFEQLCIK